MPIKGDTPALEHAPRHRPLCGPDSPMNPSMQEAGPSMEQVGESRESRSMFTKAVAWH